MSERDIDFRKYLLDLFKIALSGIISAVSMFGIKAVIGSDAYGRGFLMNAVYAVIIAAVGVAVYLLVLLMLKESTLASLKKEKKE